MAPPGPRRALELIEQVRLGAVESSPEIAATALLILGDQLTGLAKQAHALERLRLARFRARTPPAVRTSWAHNQEGRRLSSQVACLRSRLGDPPLKADGLAAAPWIRSLLERRPARVVTVAMANKAVRIAWAVLTRGEVYQPVAIA